MLFLFFLYLLSARALPVPGIDKASTPSSCKDIDNCRTLLSIIWSCVTTVFLCTWVAIHPNVPEPVDTSDMDFLAKCVHATSCFFKTKVVMFIYALLVPEYALAWAIRQRLVARKIVKTNGTYLGLLAPQFLTDNHYSGSQAYSDARIFHDYGRLSLFRGLRQGGRVL